MRTQSVHRAFVYRALVPALLLMAACDAEPRSEAQPTPDAIDLVEPAAGESSGGEVDDVEAEFEPDRLDLPSGVELSCQKIDFLFVIDDSGSMGDEQARLIDGFPGFIGGVQEAIAQYDYHMMVVTTGLGFDSEDPTQCETAIGAGRTVAADGNECGVGQGELDKRFASADEEELSDVFGCVAEVGVQGSGNELPIWSMAQAITTHSRPGGCNEGFLRDDAILVVTMITDEEDDADTDSPGDPQLWKEVVLAAKGGDEASVVMLGLLGDTDVDDGKCSAFDAMGGGAEGAPRLREFVESFEYGSWSSVCSDNYAPFFTAAVDDIGQACSDFTPVG